MSSLVLLNGEGVVARKLQLVSLPSDYVVPEGMTVSWRMDLHASSCDPLASFGPKEPVEAYFYLGNAQGQVCRDGFKEYERNDRFGPMRYGSRVLTVTVQGTSAKDVMELRDRIMHFIHSGVRWNVSNDLNPKCGLLQWLKKLVGMTK